MTTKTKEYWYKGVSVGLIAFVLGAIVYVVKKDQLTFDDQKQKNDVIDMLDEVHPMDRVKANEVIRHTIDVDAHMTFEEKKRIFIMEERQIQMEKNINLVLENQIKIGQDLQQIKNQ